MRMGLGRNVGALIEARNVSYGDVARGVGLADSQAIWLLVQRDSKKSQYAAPLAVFFRVPLERLLAEDFKVDEPAATNVAIGPEISGTVPLISWVQAGAWAAVIDNLTPGESIERIPTSVPIHEHTYALRVSGDSMRDLTGEPSFPHGSIIIVEPDAIGSLQDMAGQLVIWKRPSEEEATFKKLVKDGARYRLMPLNPQYDSMEVLEGDVCCGVVRAKEQRFF